MLIREAVLKTHFLITSTAHIRICPGAKTQIPNDENILRNNINWIFNDGLHAFDRNGKYDP